ncbi:roadblock/LC7 domain protein [Geobacter sp. OR-1]|uniref:roadblock/LC7 domain-containing protein n=1 Tax=Geobacter sp. OR-1 TaxID=1266765 RepID=UPI0005425CC5|nr:roadblock/LC7 domain-containing protein [Geobacter sp. OR-1]GAM10084.1 roadblock/LC7 domain protein [Geobacter sp. OR-1]
MPFKTILQELVDAVPGATGAILADWEGEAVEQYCHFDEFEMKVIGAHKGIILNRLRELHDALPVGEVEDLMIAAGSQRHLVAPVGPDYFLVMTMARSSLPALAQRMARLAVDRLKKEIC